MTMAAVKFVILTSLHFAATVKDI